MLVLSNILVFSTIPDYLGWVLAVGNKYYTPIVDPSHDKDVPSQREGSSHANGGIERELWAGCDVILL
jgi:hypothetical protein